MTGFAKQAAKVITEGTNGAVKSLRDARKQLDDNYHFYATSLAKSKPGYPRMDIH